MFSRLFTKSAVSLGALFIIFSSSVFASESPRAVLTFSQARDIFHSVNTDVKVAQINKGTSLRNASAFKSWIPSIGLSATLMQGSESLTPTKTDWTWTDESRRNLISAQASLSVGASNFASVFSSAISSALANYTYDTTLQNLDMALYSSYVGLASAIEALSSAEKSLKLAQEAQDNTQKKFDAGLASSLELMNAKLSYAKAQSNYSSMQNTRNTAYFNLKDMLRLDYDFDISDMNDMAFVALPDADELYRRYIDKNSTIKPLSLSHKVSQITYIALSTANRLPTLTASLAYQYGPETAGRKDGMSFTLSAAMKLDGFIPGTSTWNTINESKDNLSISRLRLEEGFYKYRSEIIKNIDNINLLEDKYKMSLSQLELASESYRLTKDAYEKGSVPMSQFDQAMESLLASEVALITANLNYKLAVYSFAVYLGEDFETFVNTYKK